MQGRDAKTRLVGSIAADVFSLAALPSMLGDAIQRIPTKNELATSEFLTRKPFLLADRMAHLPSPSISWNVLSG